MPPNGPPKKRPRRCNQGPKRFAAKVKYGEDAAKALKLKTAGLDIRSIAAAIGRSTGWCSQAIDAAIKEVPQEEAAVYRALLIARVESVFAAHYTRRSAVASARIMLAAIKQAAELIGLVSPRTEITGPNGGPIGTVDIGSLSDDQLRAFVAGGDLAALAGAGATGAPAPPAGRERPPSP